MKAMKTFVVISFFWGFFSCASDIEEYTNIPEVSEEEILSKTLNIPTSSFNYDNVVLPNYFYDNALRNEDNTPTNNAITNDGATLGRVLFYDKNLSLNNTISCASCHSQATSFSDSKQLSEGFNGEKTGRHSMSLANGRFYRNGRFFWDERALSLEDQVLRPIQDPVEMGMTLPVLEERLNQILQYKILFKRAFGDSVATSNNISLALAQFVRSMVSYQSKFDTGVSQTNNPNANFPNYTASENRGKQLFFSPQTNCAQCHTTAAFVGDRARNNGLDALLTDLGVGGITNNNNQRGQFKVPSLRNIALSAPYMHDGRFATLDDVINHYDNGVQNNQYLDNRLRQGNNGGVRRLNLSVQDKQALKDFLQTLTDDSFITDEKFSSPFKNN